MQWLLGDPEYRNRAYELLARLLPELPPSILKALVEHSQPCRAQKGEALIQQGQTSSWLLLLESGSVRICIEGESRRKHLDLVEFSAPALLGLSGAMTGEPYPSTVRAVGDVEAFAIHRENFMRVLQDSPRTSLAFSKVLMDELAFTYKRLAELREPTAVPM